jgi:hypothetical protein
MLGMDSEKRKPRYLIPSVLAAFTEDMDDAYRNLRDIITKFKDLVAVPNDISPELKSDFKATVDKELFGQ